MTLSLVFCIFVCSLVRLNSAHTNWELIPIKETFVCFVTSDSARAEYVCVFGSYNATGCVLIYAYSSTVTLSIGERSLEFSFQPFHFIYMRIWAHPLLYRVHYGTREKVQCFYRNIFFQNIEAASEIFSYIFQNFQSFQRAHCKMHIVNNFAIYR